MSLKIETDDYRRNIYTMKKIRTKADVSKANGFKIWKHCDEIGADTDGHIYQKIKGVWCYAYEYVNKWGKSKLIPRALCKLL